MMRCENCKSEMTKAPHTMFQVSGNKWHCPNCGYWQIYDSLGWLETRNSEGKIIKERRY